MEDFSICTVEGSGTHTVTQATLLASPTRCHPEAVFRRRTLRLLLVALVLFECAEATAKPKPTTRSFAPKPGAQDDNL
jgi:hypothetical protein